LKIAVDGMGGDHAPYEIVKGCVEALSEMPAEIYIVGNEEQIKEELNKYKYDETRIKIVNATEVVTNEDEPVKAIRRKKDSSLAVGLQMEKEGLVDVFVSAGNTGALVAGSLLLIGRIEGIDRPTIATVYPALDKAALLVDAGANAECRPRNFVEFGIMGSIYSENVFGVKNPSVGLVNIGVEEKKGTQTVKDAFQLLQKTHLNFAGNVEARDVPQGTVDVLVCDGFVGNVILKLSEGMIATAGTMIKTKITSSFIAKIGALLLMKPLKELKKDLDYSEYGGAPVLGIKGAVIKMHGSSKSKAVKNAIIRSIPYVEKGVVDIIHDEIIKLEEIE